MPTEFRHCEEHSFGVVIVSKNGLYDLANHTSLVQCTIDIENRDRLIEGPCQDFILSNVVLVDEETSRAAIDKRGGATLDTRVGRLEFNIDSEGVIARGGRNFKLVQESSFPGWATKTFRSR